MADLAIAIQNILIQNKYILKKIKKIEQHQYFMSKMIYRQSQGMADDLILNSINSASNHTNFINICEDFAEKATLIKENKIS